MSKFNEYSNSHLSRLNKIRKLEERAANFDLENYLAENNSDSINQQNSIDNSNIINEENLDSISNNSFSNLSLNETSNFEEFERDDHDDEFQCQCGCHSNESLVNGALLATFFSGNLTQTALKTVIELTQLFTPTIIPKNFDFLMTKIVSEQLNYEKVWFCQHCVTKVTLTNNKQRFCSTCKKKYKFCLSFNY